MALLADGWHIGSHALALGLAFLWPMFYHQVVTKMIFRFNFGTFKIEVLGGYTSALYFLIVAFFSWLFILLKTFKSS